MTMIKWINASKLHEIKEVLKLDLQNLVLRYLILISMKMQRSRPTPTTTKSASCLSHLHTDPAVLNPGAATPGNLDLAGERCCFCCKQSARQLTALQSLPFTRPYFTWLKDIVGLIKQRQLEVRPDPDEGVLNDRKKNHFLPAHEVMGILCNCVKLT